MNEQWSLQGWAGDEWSPADFGPNIWIFERARTLPTQSAAQPRQVAEARSHARRVMARSSKRRPRAIPLQPSTATPESSTSGDYGPQAVVAKEHRTRSAPRAGASQPRPARKHARGGETLKADVGVAHEGNIKRSIITESLLHDIETAEASLRTAMSADAGQAPILSPRSNRMFRSQQSLAELRGKAADTEPERCPHCLALVLKDMTLARACDLRRDGLLDEIEFAKIKQQLLHPSRHG